MLLAVWGAGYSGASAQGLLRGEVRDAETDTPLPFARIQLLGTETGTTTDLDGRFRLEIPPLSRQDSLRISYLGYRSQLVQLTPGDTLLRVRLVPQTLQFPEVEIRASAYPALEVLGRALARRDANDPERNHDFEYTAYSKLILKPAPETELSPQADSLFEKSHLMLWESITLHEHQAPDQDQETVAASRVSGLPGEALPFSPTEFQSLSFYRDEVRILGRPLLSPLARSAPRKYRYTLGDTLFSGQDTIYTLHFRPAPGLVMGFEGTMQLHSRHYALQNIEARATMPAEMLFLDQVRIRQRHTPIRDSVWFPSQLETRAHLMPDANKPEQILELEVRTELNQRQLNLNERRPRFDAITLEIDETAGDTTAQFWNRHRSDSLNAKEAETYRQIDSLLRKRRGFLGLIQRMDKLMTGRLATGPVDWLVSRLYDYNQVEHHRLGLGAETNGRLWEPLRVGGWLGYGTQDNRWKWSAWVSLLPFRRNWTRLTLSYGENLSVVGWEMVGFRAHRPLFMRMDDYYGPRKFFLRTLDYIQRWQVRAFFPTGSTLHHRLDLNRETRTPAYDYVYRGRRQFTFTEAVLWSRLAPGETYLRNGRAMQPRNLRGPVAELRLTFGLKDVLGGGWSYQKAEASVTQTLPLLRLGTLEYQVAGGWLEGDIPFPRLYSFFSNGDAAFIARKFAFNTMPLFDFQADRYVNGHLAFRIDNNRFPSRQYAPELTLLGAAGWGTLEHQPTDDPQLHPIRAPDAGYYEIGATLDHLFPRFILKYAASLQFFGIGAYYRLGPYHTGPAADNLFIKMTLSLGL